MSMLQGDEKARQQSVCVCVGGDGNEKTGQKAHQDVKQLQLLLTFQGSPQTQPTSDLWVQGL